MKHDTPTTFPDMRQCPLCGGDLREVAVPHGKSAIACLWCGAVYELEDFNNDGRKPVHDR